MKAKQNPNLITALYERLSLDDELAGESNSITNQKNSCRTTPPSGDSPTFVTSLMTATPEPTSTGQDSGL